MLKPPSKIAALLGVLACAAGAAACGSSDDGSFNQRQGTQEAAADTTGATADELLIGVHGPRTAAAAALVADVFTGFRLYVDQLNEQGGVNGRQLRLIEVDDQFTVAGGTAAAKELTQDGVLAAVNLAGADSAVGAAPVFDEQGIPYLAVALPMNKLAEAETTFLTATPLELQAATVPSFVAAKLDGRDRRIGIVTEDADIYKAMRDEITEGAAEEELEIVASETVRGDAPSFSAPLLKLRQARADTVLMIGTLSVPGILRDARSIGYEPQWSGVGPWASDTFAFLTRGAMEGIQAVRANQGVDSRAYAALAEAWTGRGPPTEIGLVGWETAAQLEQMLERTGDAPSRSGLIDALEATMDDPILGAGSSPPLRFSADRHWGSDEVMPSKVERGLWMSTGGWTARFE